MTIRWQGVFPAVTTKLKPDHSLDAEAMRAGLERLIASGVSGVLMMGMVGENAQLSPQEKMEVLRIALETVRGRIPVLSGVAETSTDRAAAFARDAQALGIDGLMVFPGLTYKSDDEETVAFYRTVAQASRLPILLYNNPRGYGVDLTPDVVARLLEEPTIVAIKEESYDTTRVTDLISRFGDRLSVVCGVDDLVLESAALGVKAWVSGMANAVPRESVDLLDMAVAGDFVRARALYAVLTPLYHLDTVVKLVQHIKLAEHLISGSAETVKPPRLKLSGAERERTIAIVRDTLAGLRRLGYDY
ncbi:dihydrodipicolinate synthase family protein [Pigmentiphaga sp. NML080357]|uniref:dihydrodipicolinate synthase family protein n=1 Tax=Pigmentiphaga sp. NML080357 TaxID=2008675 RepID=UPI000B40C701|nr:dihydrodipicolinate synthase family protein [Pigmentiphaga sp. NML080357]OVZ57484.1 dihydrodipicolinate synthase family protein [Pigmentiphaga sp. NML080357]